MTDALEFLRQGLGFTDEVTPAGLLLRAHPSPAAVEYALRRAFLAGMSGTGA